ncbi:MAG: hypothetical protein ACR5KW_04040 [Wolbachia sp.]
MLNLYFLSLFAKMVVLLSKHGHFTMKDLENIIKANRNTLKKHLPNLVNGNYITQYEKKDKAT